MPCTTPQRIDDEVRTLCRRACGSGANPLFVPVEPAHGATYKNCFLNVAAEVERSGGTAVVGWMVGIWPGVFGEAIHHAVWRSPEGALLDVTPQDPLAASPDRIAFVEDATATYDEAGYDARPSRRVALTDHPLVHQYLEACAKKDAVTRGGGAACRVDRAAFEAAMVDRTRAYRRVLAKFLGPNDPCPCMRGRKFKKCCRTLAEFERYMLSIAGLRTGGGRR